MNMIHYTEKKKVIKSLAPSENLPSSDEQADFHYSGCSLLGIYHCALHSSAVMLPIASWLEGILMTSM